MLCVYIYIYVCVSVSTHLIYIYIYSNIVFGHLKLSVVMLCGKNAWGPLPGPVPLVVSPTDIPPLGSSVLAGLVLVIIMISRHPQQ